MIEFGVISAGLQTTYGDLGNDGVGSRVVIVFQQPEELRDLENLQEARPVGDVAPVRDKDAKRILLFAQTGKYGAEFFVVDVFEE